MKITTTTNHYAHEPFMETLNSLFGAAKARKPKLRVIESKQQEKDTEKHVAIRFTRTVMNY